MLEDGARKDCEIYYMKAAFKSFLQSLGDEEYKITGLEDERLGAFMCEQHPRFY